MRREGTLLVFYHSTLIQYFHSATPSWNNPAILAAVLQNYRGPLSRQVSSFPIHLVFLNESHFSIPSLAIDGSANEWAKGRTKSLQWASDVNSVAPDTSHVAGFARSAQSSKSRAGQVSESANPVGGSHSDVEYESAGSVSPMSQDYSEAGDITDSVSSTYNESDESE